MTNKDNSTGCSEGFNAFYHEPALINPEGISVNSVSCEDCKIEGKPIPRGFITMYRSVSHLGITSPSVAYLFAFRSRVLPTFFICLDTPITYGTGAWNIYIQKFFVLE